MTCGPHLGFSWASIRRMTSSIHSIRSRTMLKKRNLSPVSTSFTRRPSAASSRFFQASRTWEGRDDRQFRTTDVLTVSPGFQPSTISSEVWSPLITLWRSIWKQTDHKLDLFHSDFINLGEMFSWFVVIFETCLFSGLVAFVFLSLCRRHHRLHSVFVKIVQSVARVQGSVLKQNSPGTERNGTQADKNQQIQIEAKASATYGEGNMTISCLECDDHRDSRFI